jgi:hypothetical protein
VTLGIIWIQLELSADDRHVRVRRQAGGSHADP